MESERELLLRIQKEFDDSAGTLTLSISEFTSFFHLSETSTMEIIEKLVDTGYYELKKEWNNIGEKIERIQLKESYTRNYWVKEELVEKEANVLLEIGQLLSTPFNTQIKHVTIKDNHLIKLDLRNQQLLILPDTIDVFTHLRELRLQNTKLTSIPETIGNLNQLKILDLDNNALRNLPDSLGKLHALEELWVRDNQLEDFPESFRKLKNLKKGSLQGNRALPKSKYMILERKVKSYERRI
ncbi:MAG: leucine-rich repeat domain-containing protein [Candidatus Hodarchaeales archaeon]|jgi:Leucine-rich repeat (LRR) protein